MVSFLRLILFRCPEEVGVKEICSRLKKTISCSLKAEEHYCNKCKIAFATFKER